MEAVLVLAGLAIFGVSCFYLGYDAARTRSRKWQQTIQKSYNQILDEQKALRGTPAKLAHTQGFSEGYRQGIEDAHLAIDRVTGEP